MKIAFQPTADLCMTVGFALFEAGDEPRKTAVRFAPRLELAESIAAALRGGTIRDLLKRTEPNISRMVSSAIGPNPLIFAQHFDIPPELRIFQLISIQTFNFDQEVERLPEELFLISDLWSKANPRPKPRHYGQSYLRRSLHDAFVERGLWRRKELQKQISVERFVSDQRLRKIYLAYKDLRNSEAKVYRMLHPVSVFGASKNAEVVANNWPKIRDGFENEIQMRCEMRAIVENAGPHKSRARTEALRLLEAADIRVDSVESVPQLAADAQAALRYA